MAIERKKVNGVAIRDDGMLYPATDNVLRNPSYRPYHGALKEPDGSEISLEKRLAYLQGFAPNQAHVAAEQGTFNIATAGKDELIDFVLTEFGKQLDGRKTIDQLRTQAIGLVKAAELPAAA